MHIGTLTVKVIVGFVALFIIVFISGRNSINQLTPFHLVFVMVLGDFLGNAVYEEVVNLLHFLYAVGLWTLLMLSLEFLTQKVKATRSVLVGNPSIIIRNGLFDRKLLKKNRLDINQISSLLRQKDVFSVREVKFGILEANGQLSILKKSDYEQPTKQDFNFSSDIVDLPITLISDGEILWDNLAERGFNKEWLYIQLKKYGFKNEKEIFFADWRENEGIHICPMK
ncbi:MAG: DUF421 domain-containing protein [Paenisporosarcina sp.]